MNLKLLNVVSLARDLATSSKTTELVKHKDEYVYALAVVLIYTVGGFISNSVVLYKGQTTFSQSVVEVAYAVLIGVAVLRHCYLKSTAQMIGFARAFVCFSVPANMWALIGLWGIYHGTYFLLDTLVPIVSFASQEDAEGFIAVIKIIYGLIPFGAAIASTTIFYYILLVGFNKLRL